MAKYAYYPGCSAHSTAQDMHESAVAVAESLGLDFIEPEGWTCCGATAAHQTDHQLAVNLAAANLITVRDMGMDMVVNCAACYNRMKSANHAVKADPNARKQLQEATGRDYDGSVRVRHIMEVLFEDIGLPKLKQKLKTGLGGLKAAPYYGCLMVRPPEVMQFDDAENPKSIDRLLYMMNGEPVEWPYKVECCGGGLSISRTDIVVNLTDKIFGSAVEAGAECIVTSCPMCHTNLDLRRLDIERQLGNSYNDMPVVYVTQLLGLCLGIPASKLGLKRLIVPADKIISSLKKPETVVIVE